MPAAPNLRLDQRLVLNGFILSLLGARTFDELTETLRDPDLEVLTEENVSRHHLALVDGLNDSATLTPDVLLQYDENIVRHTQSISRRRGSPIRWKYFQYVALLLTEIYLDRFFYDAGGLSEDLNREVELFNSKVEARNRLPQYTLEELRRIGLWMATGAGKTLLMHMNILQFLHYLRREGREAELNRILLITPNESLSDMHIKELKASGVPSERFAKDSYGLFTQETVQVIEVTKLREESGDLTVAVEAFEGNNLVLVDEGHRGAGGDEWMKYRNILSEEGFSFEYSATFGQAIKASGKAALSHQYAKAILVDYSYRFFYNDGYGKDYRIRNLSDSITDDVYFTYLTAALLAFYQQARVYQTHSDSFAPFRIELPLWIFVGSRVTKGFSSTEASDVIQILLFLAEFCGNRDRSIEVIDALLRGQAGLLADGRDQFGNAYPYLVEDAATAPETFADVLRLVFNAEASGKIHVTLLRLADGELSLTLGPDSEPFGLINVGDAPKLAKLCEKEEIFVVEDSEFATSYFGEINSPMSTIKVLIGSRKFIEGWNSFRVSSMGLLNIGKKEGSQIIQLFGRGVRLRGHGNSLKRSSEIAGVVAPPNLHLLETLNVFGVRADYMRQFKEYLEEEGLPANDAVVELEIPTKIQLPKTELKTIILDHEADFESSTARPTLSGPDEHFITHPALVDWYPKIQALESRGAKKSDAPAVKHEAKLKQEHLVFLGINRIHFELLRYKRERGWHRLEIPKEVVSELLSDETWYRLYLPAEYLDTSSLRRLSLWEDVALALLKKYCDRFYKNAKAAWERPFLTYQSLSEDDPNLLTSYRFSVDEGKTALLNHVRNVQRWAEENSLNDDQRQGVLRTIVFPEHLYKPLVALDKRGELSISPVPLNKEEANFVTDLRDFHSKNPAAFRGCELHMLRNMSKGRGIGFFEAGNFYPDFIIWLTDSPRQHILFADPKGLRNLRGADDPKIRLHDAIKEIEERLGDANVILESFILSNTPYDQITHWGLTKKELADHHVLFQRDDKTTYIKEMLVRSIGKT